jgi:8-oxo-dGTP pyrophosphatase MutT (NUDIX family)
LRETLADRPRVKPEPDGYRPASVLVPFFKNNDRWEVLFTKRTERVESHKGQVSFPGGAQDPEDDSPMATALRETEEEIGVRPADVKLVGQLDPMVTITNYLVRPFVGIIPYPYPFRLNRFEVDSLVTVPLDQLLAEAKDQPQATGPALDLTFNRQGEVIWGATARILYQLLDAVFL